MRIVIAGAGRVGSNIVKDLSEEGHDITVIDKDPQVVENIVNNYDVLGICGNCATFDIQKEAGVDKSDLFITVTPSDELNVMCCMIAKKIGTRHTIARVRNPEYSKQLHFLREELGLSMLVNPEHEAANEISRILRFPSAIKIDAFSKGLVELAEIKIEENNPFIDRPISDIYKNHKIEIIVCAVQRKDNVFIPNGNFVLQKGDKISLTANRKNLSLFMKQIGAYKQSIKRTMIIGGGKIGYYLASQLLELGFKVKILEMNKERCIDLSDLLPKAEIICTDGTSEDQIKECGVEEQDAVVCLTNIDEENIITSLYASSLGVRKTVTKINRMSNEMLDTIGIESVISPKILASNRVVKYVRALQNSEGISVQTIYNLVGGKVTALEFHIESENEYTSIPFRSLPLKNNMIVCCLIRNHKVIFPRGDDTIEAGERQNFWSVLPLRKGCR
ncbi:MAG: Trk system potassium transporter TrkA [Clostridia bacterium]|nr:Trk system potassium transporter TrkA [Clostridia bacterium]